MSVLKNDNYKNETFHESEDNLENAEIDKKESECIKAGSNNSLECQNCEKPKNEKRNIINKKSWIIIAVIIVVLIASIVVVAYTKHNELELKATVESEKQSYEGSVLCAYYIMEESIETNAYVCELVSKVWRDSIDGNYSNDETWMYVTSDANKSIEKLFADENFIPVIESLKELQTSTANYMQYITDPPKGCEELYDNIKGMYYAYMSINEMAIAPSGSLSSYISQYNESVEDYKKHRRQLEFLLNISGNSNESVDDSEN